MKIEIQPLSAPLHRKQEFSKTQYQAFNRQERRFLFLSLKHLQAQLEWLNFYTRIFIFKEGSRGEGSSIFWFRESKRLFLNWFLLRKIRQLPVWRTCIEKMRTKPSSILINSCLNQPLFRAQAFSKKKTEPWVFPEFFSLFLTCYYCSLFFFFNFFLW